MSVIELKYRYNWTLVIFTFFFIICSIIFYLASTTQILNLWIIDHLSGQATYINNLKSGIGVAFGFNIFFGTVFLIAGIGCGIERARTRKYEIY